jgi:predicted O-linked N-acetylglucosamine transferase (SPINDLY family)
MVDDSKRVASSRIFTREECGLPSDKFVYCCFNNFYKFNPSILDSWSRIFLAVEDSVIWLSEFKLSGKADKRV